VGFRTDRELIDIADVGKDSISRNVSPDKTVDVLHPSGARMTNAFAKDTALGKLMST